MRGQEEEGNSGTGYEKEQYPTTAHYVKLKQCNFQSNLRLKYMLQCMLCFSSHTVLRLSMCQWTVCVKLKQMQWGE